MRRSYSLSSVLPPTFLLAGLLLVSAGGCDPKPQARPDLGGNSTDADSSVPAYIKGTVAEYATVVGGETVSVQAHGLVIGLGDKGSAEVPAPVYNAMAGYLSKQKLGSAQHGTQDLTPERILTDKDTSVVLVGGAVERGAPVGSRFDVYVSALPNTQTISLDGGILMPIDLSLAYGGISDPNVTTHIWAKAGGPVFINPFVEPGSADRSAKLLSGKVIGGGTVTRRQPVRLQLHRPDAQLAEMIQRRLHTRFAPGEEMLLSGVVKGRSRSIVEVTVPGSYGDDYRHFLALVTHMPIRYGAGGPEAYAREICRQMEMPVAEHDDLAIILEAMGRQTLPLVKALYGSETPPAAFYSARTGLRLGDMAAAEVVVRYAASAASAFQIPAIEELGAQPRVFRGGPVLRRLLDDPDEQVRLAAYEALRDRGDTVAITTLEMPDQFTLDVVRTSREYSIYAMQTGEARVVLFGAGMAVKHPLYFESPDQVVTINAFDDSDKLTMFRKVPVGGRMSDPILCGFLVQDMVEALGRMPEPDTNGKVNSLGLDYSRVVSVLYSMCKSGSIPARFVLQQTDDLRRIYRGGAAAGRPDMPG
jgi:hypothetical protein